MGVVSRRWMWAESMGVALVVRRYIYYIDFLILLIPIYSSCICSIFAAASLLFVQF